MKSRCSGDLNSKRRFTIIRKVFIWSAQEYQERISALLLLFGEAIRIRILRSLAILSRKGELHRVLYVSKLWWRTLSTSSAAHHRRWKAYRLPYDNGKTFVMKYTIEKWLLITALSAFLTTLMVGFFQQQNTFPRPARSDNTPLCRGRHIHPD